MEKRESEHSPGLWQPFLTEVCPHTFAYMSVNLHQTVYCCISNLDIKEEILQVLHVTPQFFQTEAKQSTCHPNLYQPTSTYNPRTGQTEQGHIWMSILGQARLSKGTSGCQSPDSPDRARTHLDVNPQTGQTEQGQILLIKQSQIIETQIVEKDPSFLYRLPSPPYSLTL